VMTRGRAHLGTILVLPLTLTSRASTTLPTTPPHLGQQESPFNVLGFSPILISVSKVGNKRGRLQAQLESLPSCRSAYLSRGDYCNQNMSQAKLDRRGRFCSGDFSCAEAPQKASNPLFLVSSPAFVFLFWVWWLMVWSCEVCVSWYGGAADGGAADGGAAHL